MEPCKEPVLGVRCLGWEGCFFHGMSFQKPGLIEVKMNTTRSINTLSAEQTRSDWQGIFEEHSVSSLLSSLKETQPSWWPWLRARLRKASHQAPSPHQAHVKLILQHDPLSCSPRQPPPDCISMTKHLGGGANVVPDPGTIWLPCHRVVE